VEDRLQFLFQQHGRRGLRYPVGRIRDGDFILPSCSRVWGEFGVCDGRWSGRLR
jgi:hypothetical protein